MSIRLIKRFEIAIYSDFSTRKFKGLQRCKLLEIAQIFTDNIGYFVEIS